MSKVVFAGCSFTAGNGWVDAADATESLRLECKDHPDLWTNLCATQIDQIKNKNLMIY
jgi:hypothetical protein